MRKFPVLVLPVIWLGLAGIGCNERAQMGQGDQRNHDGGRIIPANFSNTLSAEQFRGRALNLTGTALTLNPTVEAALAGDELVETTSSSFAASCKSLAMVTGGISGADTIRNLSQQPALNLSAGTANCKDIPAIIGIDSFRTMNALRFLATELAADTHLVTDCLAMQEKRSGRQAALSWTLEPVLGQGTWLEGKNLKYFAGGVEGGGNDRQNAFSSWLNIETVTDNDGTATNNKLMSAVTAFNDVSSSKTTIEKVEQYEQATSGDKQNQTRTTQIELDYAKGEIKELTTYRTLVQGALVSEWSIAATIAGVDSNLVLELSTNGADASVEYSLDANNNVGCSVSN